MRESENYCIPESDASGVALVFRTLRYRNYRLFFLGNGVAMIGSWMQQIAMSWLVYRLTNSAFLLGIIAFAGLFPGFLLTPLAGVLSDRWDRRHIILVAQVFAMLQALVLAILVVTDTIAVWHIILLSVVLGLVIAFDVPARQSFIIYLIGRRQDLGSAIALNSAMFNGARLIGPSIAGVTIAVAGEAICFFWNAFSYLVLIWMLMLMKTEPIPRSDANPDILEGFKAGFRYAFGFLPVRYLLMLLGLTSLMGMPYVVLLPVFARHIFHGGPQTLGFLTAASGAGALTAALYLASRVTVAGMGWIVPCATAVFGTGLILFSLSQVMGLSLFLLFLIGGGMMLQLALTNTILQTVVDDEMRGRVMSFFAMTFMGTAPIGNLAAGALADVIGAPLTLIIGGTCCIVGALLYARKLPVIREKARPIYERKGVLKC